MDAGVGPRWCQTDGLLFDVDRGLITLVECKYQHTSDAWWQLKMLYLPVLRTIFPGWEFATVEVVKWYDPATKIPEPVFLLPDVGAAQPGKFNVHIWNPRR
jgi:hypothetical protein